MFIEDTEFRSQDFACSVGISKDIARIFVSRIPVVTSTAKGPRDNYEKIFKILSTIAVFRGCMSLKIAKFYFTKENDSNAILEEDMADFRRFIVMKKILTMRFPREVNKSELSDDEIELLFNWLVSQDEK